MSSLLNIRRSSSLLFSSGGDIEYALRRPIEGDENAQAEAGSVDGRIRVASRNKYVRSYGRQHDQSSVLPAV